MKKIAVVGSLSMDFVVETDEKPGKGETVFGKNFQTSFGGKGANQAVAAQRLGCEVKMFGCVGADSFGNEIISNLKKQNVNVDYVERVTHEASGSAHITLFQGDNSIIVVPSANNQMTPEKINAKMKNALLGSDIVMLQQEIPQDTIEAIIDFCFENKIMTILNPAPARLLSQAVIEKVTYLTPNEHECQLIFSDKKVSEVIEAYPNKLIVTLGSKGALFHDGKQEIMVKSFKVKPTDTTGAGDTFNGALAVGILKGFDLASSIRFANLAASLSVQKFGAQGGMPTVAEMKESDFFEEEWHVE